MRIRTLLFSIVLCLSATSSMAEQIDRQQARQVAQQFVAIADNTSDDIAPAPYYVFSRGSGKGYVIVSGDDSTAPILAIVDSGDFDIAAMPPMQLNWIRAWEQKIKFALQQPKQPSLKKGVRARALADYKRTWKDVPALVKTHWHQSTPYNDLAPVKEGVGRCMTGCVATAGSQVTYYYNKDNPTELQYDTPTYGYGTPITVSLPKGTPIQWNLMRLSGSGTEAQNNAVATLMYALGTSAWLTYGDGDGLSTSGHNEKMAEAMRGQFFLDSKHSWKSEFSQKGWEELIYQNLVSKRPMLYSGAHPDQGGHSVVLDGYQANTGLYHFNFGWGGQGDGWYTVDDETGMNGFNSYQDLVYNVTPRYQNLSGSVVAGELYHKARSTVKVQVKNNGTLDYAGIYIYTNTKAQLPSQVANSDQKTVIASGKSAELSFDITPQRSGKLYVFLCGANKVVLDTCEMEVAQAIADLSLTQMKADVGTRVLSANGIEYGVVNNTTATVSVSLTNGAGGTLCQPTFRCFLDKFDTADGTWKRETSLIYNTMLFHSNESRDTTFVFKNLTPGVIYKAYLDKDAVASTQTAIRGVDDYSVCFTVSEPSLSVAVSGQQAVVTGQWNAALFEQQCGGAEVCAYDITGLTELNSQPQTPNRNALFYSDATEVDYADIYNVVVGNNCRKLLVQSGFNFRPLKTFTAEATQFVVADAKAGKWVGVLVPFAADVPYGMQVKTPTELKGNIVEHEAVSRIERMTPALVLTGHDALVSIDGGPTEVSTETACQAQPAELMSHTVTTEVKSPCLFLGEYLSSLYFIRDEARTQVMPFEVVLKSDATRVRTTSTTAADANYKVLSADINDVYGFLATVGDVGSDAFTALMAELKRAEDMLTYRSAAADEDIIAEAKTLRQALADFKQAYQTGIAELRFNPTVREGAAKPARYNLKGMPVGSCLKGLVIIRDGNTVRKVLVR